MGRKGVALMAWNQDEHDDIASVLEGIAFKCECGDTIVHLTDLETQEVIDWLRNKVPIYHWGLVGCCEKLRCRHCDEMPKDCEIDAGCVYEPWGDDE